MRTIILMLCVSISAFSQMQLDYNGGAAQFQKVIEVPNKPAAELYKIANKWVATTYKNPGAATYANIENEMLKGEGFDAGGVKLAAIAFADMIYSWRIDVKDNKARFTISNMTVLTSNGIKYAFESYLYKKDGTERVNYQATNVKESFERHANRLLESLESYYLNPSKDDW